MSIFVLVFVLFMVGMCFVVSSPVPSTWGKRAFLFVVGAALWVGAYILVRTNQESLVDFLFSDYALSGRLANQVGASLVVFGFGWFIFIVSSVRTERRRASQFEQYWSTDTTQEQVKAFRPWPGLLVWIPVVVLLAAVWIVQASLGGYDIESTATPTATVTATKKPTATPTKVPTWTLQPENTSTPSATATTIPTNTPTIVPTVTPTQDPSKPALACNGTWLHEEPIAVGNIRTLFELCADGFRFAAHEVDLGWDPIPTESMTVMPGGGARLEFQMHNGELLVNGTPFAQWLASQGGK